MNKFDINEYKENPNRKLILRHYREDQPETWPIEEAEIAMGDQLIIRVPNTGYSTEEYVLVDNSGEVRDKNRNLVGTVEFASEKMTLADFTDKLFKMPLNQTFDFNCDEDNGCEFGTAKIRMFDSILIIIAAYGGSNSHLIDITGETDTNWLDENLNKILEDYFTDYIYIDLCTNKEELINKI
jgi:hypothetical protein